MGQVFHGGATTTTAIRRATRHSQESLRGLAQRYGLNPKTVAKLKSRNSVQGLPTGPKQAQFTVLSGEDEAVVVAFRRHTLLPLYDCLCALQTTIPHLTPSSLHRCLQRQGISRLPELESAALGKRKFKTNGQVERVNRTLKEATVKRFHYDNHDQLGGHLADFVNAYNFGRRLKTLKGLTPYEAMCKTWTSEPKRFTGDPLTKCWD